MTEVREATFQHNFQIMSDEHPIESSCTLFEALKESLARRGSLDRIRSIIRAETYETLQTAFRADETKNISKDRLELPIEMKIAEELFMDYLKMSRLHETLSIFKVETNRVGPSNFINNDSLTKSDIEKELGIGNEPCKKCYKPYEKDCADHPLILRIIEKMRDDNRNQL